MRRGEANLRVTLRGPMLVTDHVIAVTISRAGDPTALEINHHVPAMLSLKSP